MLIWYYLDSRVQEENYDQLSAMVSQARPTIAEDHFPDSTAPTEPVVPWITINDPATGQPVQILPEFAQLYTMNNDLVGWIRIPGTNIDYPMMQTPGRPDYYLRRDFNKKKATHGCIYAKEECDLLNSDNVTIYGHYMRNGSMFAALGKYKKEAFWNENKTILLDTLTHRREYEIFAVFVTSASQGKGFRYHTFIEADSQANYDNFVSQCKALSLYDTGITPQYGEKLITLSTCEKSLTNGRLVVVARLIEEQ
jgi:sortase B